MNTYQLWIQNPSHQFVKLGPPVPGGGEPVARTTYATAKTVWPGPRPEVPLSSTEGFIEGEG